MKRSEMLRFIKHCIKTASKGNEARVVLDQIEAMGMLPPYSDPEGLYNESLVDAYIWEDEDEG